MLYLPGQCSEHALDCDAVIVPGELRVLLGDEEGGGVVGLAAEGLVQLVLVGQVVAAAHVVVVLSSLESAVVAQLVDVGPQQVGLCLCLLGALCPAYALQVALEVAFHVVPVVEEPDAFGRSLCFGLLAFNHLDGLVYFLHPVALAVMALRIDARV